MEQSDWSVTEEIVEPLCLEQSHWFSEVIETLQLLNPHEWSNLIGPETSQKKIVESIGMEQSHWSCDVREFVRCNWWTLMNGAI